MNRQRLNLLRADPLTAPDTHGVVVIDAHGDRTWGTKTAHIGKQYLANLGTIDTGVVRGTRRWADERVYYPLAGAPIPPRIPLRAARMTPGCAPSSRSRVRW